MRKLIVAILSFVSYPFAPYSLTLRMYKRREGNIWTQFWDGWERRKSWSQALCVQLIQLLSPQHHTLPLLTASLMNTCSPFSVIWPSVWLMRRHLTLKWRGAELSFQCIREGLGEDRGRRVPRRWAKASSFLSPHAQSKDLQEEMASLRGKTPDTVNSMGFSALFYPSSLVSFHKKEDYWFPGKGAHAHQAGQIQRALSFSTPAQHTHCQSPLRSLWMWVCITAEAFQGYAEVSKVKAWGNFWDHSCYFQLVA